MIVEDGNFVPGANSYASVSYADIYFTSRPNAVWDDAGLTDPEKEVALIAATDYIENRFSLRFLGQKEFSSNLQARNVLTLILYNSDPLTITVGSVAGVVGTDIARGTTRSEFLDNIIDFFNEADAGFTAEIGIDSSVIFTYDDDGIDGNYIACTSSDTDIATFALASMAGGSTYGAPQPLSFPRKWLIDRYGTTIYGVPDEVRKAVCEYAVRSISAALLPDPTVSTTGQVVTRLMEKIGPIETETEYQSGSTNLLQSYPAADRLLVNLIGPANGVIR